MKRKAEGVKGERRYRRPAGLTKTTGVKPLLEKGPKAPVRKGLRYRFLNRYPETETKSHGY